MALGMDRVREHEKRAADVRARRARRASTPTSSLYGPMDAGIRCGVIPFNVPGVHPHDVAQVLDRSGVAVRAGHHCTMPLHERLDLAGHRPRELQRLHDRGRHRRARRRASARSSGSSADLGDRRCRRAPPARPGLRTCRPCLGRLVPRAGPARWDGGWWHGSRTQPPVERGGLLPRRRRRPRRRGGGRRSAWHGVECRPVGGPRWRRHHRGQPRGG